MLKILETIYKKIFQKNKLISEAKFIKNALKRDGFLMKEYILIANLDKMIKVEIKEYGNVHLNDVEYLVHKYKINIPVVITDETIFTLSFVLLKQNDNKVILLEIIDEKYDRIIQKLDYNKSLFDELEVHSLVHDSNFYKEIYQDSYGKLKK